MHSPRRPSKLRKRPKRPLSPRRPASRKRWSLRRTPPRGSRPYATPSVAKRWRSIARAISQAAAPVRLRRKKHRVVQGVIGAPHLSRQRERGSDFARRANPAAEPRRNCAEHESDEAEEAGPGRVSPRHLCAPCGLLLGLIQRLSGLLLDLVQTIAGLVRANVRDARQAVHRLIPCGVGSLLIAADARANIGH